MNEGDLVFIASKAWILINPVIFSDLSGLEAFFVITQSFQNTFTKRKLSIDKKSEISFLISKQRNSKNKKTVSVEVGLPGDKTNFSVQARSRQH